MSSSGDLALLSVVFIGLGGLCVLIGIGAGLFFWRRLRTWRRETGYAVDEKLSTKREDGRMRTVSNLVLEYTDRTGTTHRTVSSIGTSGALSSNTQFPYRVEVLVHPTDPARFEAVQLAPKMFIAGFFTFIGAFFMVLGFVFTLAM